MDLLSNNNNERGVFRNKRAQKIQQETQAQCDFNGHQPEFDPSPNYNTNKPQMGCTFGDKGFFNPASKKNLQNSPKMAEIPEKKTEGFQENMLLSFYNWP